MYRRKEVELLLIEESKDQRLTTLLTKEKVIEQREKIRKFQTIIGGQHIQ